MATLYELTSGYEELFGRFEEAETEEEQQSIWAEIEQLDSDVKAKADAYARIRQNKLAEAEMYKAEIARLQARKRSCENTADKLMNSIKDAMIATGIREIPTSIGKFRMQLNPLRCEIVDESKVPEEFKSYEVKIDKRGILERHKATDEIIDGCEFVRDEGVRFR